MSLKGVLSILDEIANLNGTLDKIAVLRRYLDKPYPDTFLLREVIELALSTDYVFHIRDFPKFVSPIHSTHNAHAIFQFLRKLNTQEGASKKDKEHLFELASIDVSTYEVVRRICEGDLKCGLAAKNVNKACPGFITYMPYMRCSSEQKIANITYPAYAQEKNDGTFANVLVHQGHVEIKTRNGKYVQQLYMLKDAFLSSGVQDMVFTGELLIWDDRANKPMDRATGNGIITSCIYGTADQNMADKALIRLWDAVKLDRFVLGFDQTPYRRRFSISVAKVVEAVNDKTKVDSTFSTIVHSEQEAREFYRNIRAQGGEGEVLKNTHFPWKDHTSPDQVKMVNISSAELTITGWNYGKPRSKYENVCGALNCESACGKLKVNVSGMTDAQRSFDWDSHIGDIVTIEYKELSQGKGKGTMSMTHPRFKELRPDRKEAQTLEDIIKR